MFNKMKIQKKTFRIFIIAIAILIPVVAFVIFDYKNFERIRNLNVNKPIMATDETSAVCCSEERMISIYEGIEPLEESYELVMEAIANKDTVNINAITIIQLWEDSLRRKDALGMPTIPIKPD